MRLSVAHAGFRIFQMIEMIHTLSVGSRLDNEKTSLFSYPVEDAPAPVSPWPDSHPDQGILEVSDTEYESYESDDGME